MKIKDGFLLKSVAGREIVVPVGAASIDFNAMVTLNETGAFLFRQLETSKTAEELTAALLEEYDVTPERAAASVARFAEDLRGAGLLDDETADA